jgi:RNA polymerase sigma-70 factor (ECF subfamily)
VADHEPLPGETVALIARAGSGERRAIEQLIGLYQQRMARFVIGQTGDQTHYEDLCQTVFVKMVLALPRLRSPERFEPWLFQIARNVCRDHLRAKLGWRKLFVAYAPTHEAVPLAEVPTDSELADRMESRMAELPQAQQTVLRLSLEGRSYEEVARLSQTSVPAVKSRLHRARENLRLLFAGETEP